MKGINSRGDKFISIVVPALNEELTVGRFIEWCQEGLARAGVQGEILIIDSSADNTAEIAQQHGAVVIKTAKRGLGQAYIDALAYVKGDYVIMGDCDLTYDFRDIKAFVDKLDEGNDFVMGSRIRGHIQDGAMPPLHRYFGNPLTTFVLNIVYGSNFSDIHCGMRALTIDAFRKIDLESTSWEYASEMLLKAVKLRLQIAEVPVKFYKDVDGRLSHHKRSGWLSPWLAGWINLRVVFVYAPDFFLKWASALSLGVGYLLVLIVSFGPVTIWRICFSLHWLLLGIFLIVIGYSSFQMTILTRVVSGFTPERIGEYRKVFGYNRGMLMSVFLLLIGFPPLIQLINEYAVNNFHLRGVSHEAVLGLLAVTMAFQTFTFTLLLNLAIRKKP
ncbi:MAG: glycosyltransferase family 2 protein [Candidatus Omnitrophica bacterium]|nr:glycosyltransferase family 2 protein [Candidatus Omnitrophota bacterium]